MKSRTSIILIIISLFISSCGENTSEELPLFNYSNPKIGWTIKVPSGWKKNSMREVIEKNGAGIEAMEGATKKEIDLASINYSLNFQKDDLNVFQSVYEPFTEEEPGLWERNNAAIKVLFANVYEQQGIKIDTTATTVEKVGGVPFKTYEITMFEEGKPKLYQIFYSSYIRGFDFSVCLNYNSKENKEELLSIWRRSKFN